MSTADVIKIKKAGVKVVLNLQSASEKRTDEQTFDTNFSPSKECELNDLEYTSLEMNVYMDQLQFS